MGRSRRLRMAEHLMLKRMRIAGFLTMLFIFSEPEDRPKRLFRRTRPREPSYSSYMIRSEATKSLAPQKMRKTLLSQPKHASFTKEHTDTASCRAVVGWSDECCFCISWLCSTPGNSEYDQCCEIPSRSLRRMSWSTQVGPLECHRGFSHGFERLEIVIRSITCTTRPCHGQVPGELSVCSRWAR